MKKVFMDSSVVFTAVNSPIGGSAKLFVTPGVKLVTSRIVLMEVERNIRKKLTSYHVERFFLLVSKLEILEQELDEELVGKAKLVIVEKDAVILAEAKQSGVDYLVTLDKKDFLVDKVGKFMRPQRVVTPKDLLGLI